MRATSGPVLSLAADGDRAAFVVEGRVRECWSVMVWQPQRRRIHQLRSAAACESTDRDPRRGTPEVALGGTRAAWVGRTGTNNLYTALETATLARPKPVRVALGIADDGVAGIFVHRPFGDGSLLAFTQDERCHPDYERYLCPPGRKVGDVFQATVRRVVGPRLATAESELTLLAIDAGRIVVRTQSGITLMDTVGRVLRRLPSGARRAALSGDRLALRAGSAVEVYNTRTGSRTDRFPAGSGVSLEDLDGTIVVTAQGGTVALRRLGGGPTTRLHVVGNALAALEPAGLFVAGSRRVIFLPRSEVLRRLGA
ncbi:MAG TPA: hypothetical protein VFM13_06375 [Gaiellaceae bacterium]|nr:hypothetical protein [Gaiellaceae bacterium]